MFFEALSYTEVLLRNAMDAPFAPVRHDEAARDSWLCNTELLKPKSLERVFDAISKVEQEGKSPTRARVVANLPFGFWRALLSKNYKSLWIERLHSAFPNGSGDRKQVARLMADLNPFRNRLAHHEAIINADIAARHRDLIDLTNLIDVDAAAWIGTRSQVPEVLAWRPPLTGRRRVMARIGITPRTVRFHIHR